MIFQKLTIRNFGLFCGTHEFDLAPRVKYQQIRPIILFGGKNGSGKTTFLEAIMLCLYGRSTLGNRVREKDYLNYLSDRIHRPRGGGGVALRDASIRLEFSYTHFGDLQVYTVERSWRCKGDQVEESLKLEREGKPLPDLEAEYAQDFLRDLIPIGVCQLFFFDGEKIQKLAEEEQNGTALADSVKSMLSLDIVEQLQADLRIYLTRQKKKGQIQEIERQIQRFDDELRALREKRFALVQDRSQTENTIERTQSEIAEAEDRFASAGGLYAKKRNELKARAAILHTEIEQIEYRIREACEGLFPFALVPELSLQLQNQLNRENEVRKWQSAQELISENLGKLEEQISDEILKNHKLSTQARGAISNQIGALLSKAIQPPEVQGRFESLHELSTADTYQILDWIQRGIPTEKKRVGEDIKRLEKAWRELNEVGTYLGHIPEDDAIAPFIQELNELNQKFGASKSCAEQQEKEIRQVEYQIAEISRQYKRFMDELSVQEDLIKRIQLVGNVQDVLKEFQSELAQAKVTQLEHAVAQCFSRLCRKGDVVRRIKIDPHTFVVTLYNREGRAIPKKQLSAGEKQIYAISMLWALAQTSGRPLPVIIDTPLGRLDSDHRRNLVENYFPRASHQVIILSTDTEIDQEYFKALSPSVSHAYHLEYDPESETTEASEGYFWKRNSRIFSDEDEQDPSLLRSIGTA